MKPIEFLQLRIKALEEENERLERIIQTANSRAITVEYKTA